MGFAFFVAALVTAWFFLYRYGKVSPVEARRLVEGGARLIDVRTPGEFEGAHVEGAENVPIDEIAARAKEILEEGRPVVVYCASGVRSAAAKRRLAAAGVKEVHDLGPMSRWRPVSPRS